MGKMTLLSKKLNKMEDTTTKLITSHGECVEVGNINGVPHIITGHYWCPVPRIETTTFCGFSWTKQKGSHYVDQMTGFEIINEDTYVENKKLHKVFSIKVNGQIVIKDYIITRIISCDSGKETTIWNEKEMRKVS